MALLRLETWEAEDNRVKNTVVIAKSFRRKKVYKAFKQPRCNVLPLAICVMFSAVCPLKNKLAKLVTVSIVLKNLWHNISLQRVVNPHTIALGDVAWRL